MTAAKTFRVKSKIATLALLGGGIRASEAIAKAESNVATLDEACIAQIDDLLAQMSGQFERKNRGPAASLEHLYLLSTRILDVVGALPDTGVAEAAYSLCDLIDIMGDTPPDWPSVEVHIDTLRMLRSAGADMSPMERAAILAGLTKVCLKAKRAV